nr:MAG TPA: hypothetical protein [Caudoviricetes sp.]
MFLLLLLCMTLITMAITIVRYLVLNRVQLLLRRLKIMILIGHQ